MIDDQDMFNDLKELGFDEVESDNFFIKPTPEEQKGKKERKPKTLTVEDVLYDKTYTCPICGKVFKSKAVRAGKNQLIATDIDLKNTYEIVNPALYECIVCESCGYAALSKNFTRLTANQVKWIKEKICTKYKPTKYSEILTPEEGVLRYKLALLNAHAKRAKEGEKAYICLKIAWLYRDINDVEKEEAFLKNVLQGFQNALLNERFPVCDIDDLTASYIVATIYYRFKDYREALRWVRPITLEQSISPTLKKRAIDLKEKIYWEDKTLFKRR